MFTIRMAMLHSSAMKSAGGMFRGRRNLPVNPNEWGPLVDLPDYRKLDGSHPEFTSKGQRRRKIKNISTVNEVMAKLSEIKETMSEHEKLEDEKKQADENAKRHCFKSKGKLL